MIIPSSPPPDPPRISAVEYRLCQPSDLKCRIESINDALEALAGLRSSSTEVSALPDRPTAGVSVAPGTVQLSSPGYPPQVITGDVLAQAVAAVDRLREG